MHPTTPRQRRPDGARMATGTRNVSENWHGPCAAAQAAPGDSHPHASWDLDIGDACSWLRAQRICVEQCPFLAACLGRRLEVYSSSNPRSVIWAGAAYSETGRVLDAAGLRRLSAVHRNRHKRGRPSGLTLTAAVA